MKGLVPATLTIEEFRVFDHSDPPLQYPPNQNDPIHFYMSALLVVAEGTPLGQLTAAEQALNGKYFRKGYFIEASRTNEGTSMRHGSTSANNKEQMPPFGAQPVQPSGPSHHPSARPPPPMLRGNVGGSQSFSHVPPPASFGRQTQGFGVSGEWEVSPEIPSDLDHVKLINAVVERVLAGGPEMESLLMSQEYVQKDPKFAWIWDETSAGGRYYRWRLWQEGGLGKHESIFDKNVIFYGEAPWKKPKETPPFEFCTSIEDLANHPDFEAIEANGGEEEPEDGVKDAFDFLGPYLYSTFQYHLDNLPNSPNLLAEMELKYVVTFALDYANKAIKEIALRLMLQLHMAYHSAMDTLLSPQDGASEQKEAEPSKPIPGDEPQTRVNPINGRDQAMSDQPSMARRYFDPYDEEYPPDEGAEYDELQIRGKPKEVDDPSGPILVALYVLTDVMFQAKEEGDYRKMRYAEHFEEMLKERSMFSKLGRLDRDFKWGRIRADRWQKQVKAVLDNWEKNSLVRKAALEAFKRDFTNPPLTEDEKHEIKALEAKKAAALATSKPGFKSVGQPSAEEDIDGVPMSDDEDIDGEPMSEEDIDGEPMSEEDVGDVPTIQNELEERFAQHKGGADSTIKFIRDGNDGTTAKIDSRRIINPAGIMKGSGIGDELNSDEGTDDDAMQESEDEDLQHERSETRAKDEHEARHGSEAGASASEAVYMAVLEEEGGTQHITSDRIGEGPLSLAVGTVPKQAPAGQRNATKPAISFAIKGAAKAKAVKPKALRDSSADGSDKE